MAVVMVSPGMREESKPMKPYCSNCKNYKHSEFDPGCKKGKKQWGYLLIRSCFEPGVEGVEFDKLPPTSLKKPKRLDPMRHKNRKI